MGRMEKKKQENWLRGPYFNLKDVWCHRWKFASLSNVYKFIQLTVTLIQHVRHWSKLSACVCVWSPPFVQNSDSDSDLESTAPVKPQPKRRRIIDPSSITTVPIYSNKVWPIEILLNESYSCSYLIIQILWCEVIYYSATGIVNYI